MAAKKNKDILWEVGCEGHTDAWVNAESWELATVAAAEFWGVPWREVAAKCEMKKKIVGAPRNVCCRCGRVYYYAAGYKESTLDDAPWISGRSTGRSREEAIRLLQGSNTQTDDIMPKLTAGNSMPVVATARNNRGPVDDIMPKLVK